MTTDRPYDLTDCLERILAFRDARDWQQFHKPKDLAAALAIEAAELQEVFLWQEALGGEAVQRDNARMAKAREEAADCAIYLLLIAHELGIELPRAVDEKLDVNAEKYPVDEHRGVAQKSRRG